MAAQTRNQVLLTQPPRLLSNKASFLPVSRDDIQEIIMKQGDVTILCRRDGQRWIVVEPAGLDVSSDLVTSFVENLTPTKEVIIIDKEPKDTAPYGLDRPQHDSCGQRQNW